MAELRFKQSELDGDTTRRLAGYEDAKELRGDQLSGHPKVVIKDKKSSAKDGSPERLRCQTIQKEMRSLDRFITQLT